jgi:hypothetical protein
VLLLPHFAGVQIRYRVVLKCKLIMFGYGGARTFCAAILGQARNSANIAEATKVAPGHICSGG